MKNKKLQNRLKRKRRIRKKVFGTAEVPRLTIFRSVKHIHAQIINDSEGFTLISSSTFGKEVKERIKNTGNCEAAKVVGEDIGEKALQKGIKRVVFDRNGFIYHGRVKAFATGAKGKGLQF